MLQAPIPGQSLTDIPGSAPHEMPPQHTDINTALEEIFTKLTTPKQVVRLTLILRKGVPVEYIAKTILFEGFTKGKWTPDMAFLMLKIVMSMIIAVAHLKKIKVTIRNPDREQEAFLDEFGGEPEDIIEQPEEPATEDTGLPPQLKGLLGVKL